MNNSEILKLLEKQRDDQFRKLQNTSVSGLYKKEYDDVKAGRIFIFDTEEKEMVRDLKRLSKDTSHDEASRNKLNEYLKLDNAALTVYFESELKQMLVEIFNAGNQDEIQALFIEYDYYYHYTSNAACYGPQDYPVIEEPRYISNEYDYNKLVLIFNKSINFHPAWVDCQEFENLDYLELNYDLEELFQLHSRALLHKALENLNKQGELNFLSVRPFTFYINQHDCEVMMLYRLN